MSRSASPVILLAFADPRRDLVNLKAESNGIRDIFWRADSGIEVIVLEHPSLDQIVGTFQRYRDRVAVFHYGGHANGFALLLETVSGDSHQAGAAGLAKFLGMQQGLQLVFLNGCSTRNQVEGLLTAGVNCVIATTCAISDAVATGFATQFYGSLTTGADIQRAFHESSATVQSQHGDQTRLLVAVDDQGLDVAPVPTTLPWELHPVRPDAVEWTLSRESLRRRRTAAGETPLETASLKQLQILLSRVRESWIDGYLNSSVKREELIVLGKELRPDLIDRRWESVVSTTTELQHEITTRGILDLFDEAQQSLLIVGQPGSGKTTTLLDLTKKLVARAESEPDQPVPVVFHLSTWNPQTGSLQNWMEQELSDKYLVPRRIGSRWIAEQRLILVLDGLDEVTETARRSCVQAIHRFLNEVGTLGIVICCRLNEYLAIGERLKLDGAVCLLPLSDSQIREQSGRDDGGSALQQLIESHAPLRELAQSPLMLGIMRDAYRGATPTEPTAVRESAHREDHLFQTYINTMFQQQAKLQKIPSGPMMGWMRKLAQTMNQTGRSIFQIEELQPDLLNSRAWRVAYRMGLVVLLGLTCGGMTSLFWGSISSLSADAGIRMRLGLARWLTGSLLVWFGLFALSENFELEPPGGQEVSRIRALLGGVRKSLLLALLWSVAVLPAVLWGPSTRSAEGQLITLLPPLIVTGVLVTVMFGAYGRRRKSLNEIRFVESLGYSLRHSLWGALSGLIGGLGVWLAFLTWGNAEVAFYWQGPATPYTGRIVFLLTILTLGIEGGVILGGLTPQLNRGKTRPNEGLRLCLRNAIKVGTLAGTTFAVTIAVILGLIHQHSNLDSQLSRGGSFVVVCGISTWFAVALWFGLLESMKHYVLRIVIAVSGLFPFRLEESLKTACRLRFLQRAGGGYLFLHRLFQDYFARLSPEASEFEPNAETTSRPQ